MAASITTIGGLLALTLDREGGSRSRDPSLSSDPLDAADAETGFAPVGGNKQLVASPRFVPRPTTPIPEHPPSRHDELSPLRNSSSADAPPITTYGATSPPVPTTDQPEPRFGVPLGERSWTLSSAVSGNSGYGDQYRSRFANGSRRRFSATSLRSAIARRRVGMDEGYGDRYVNNDIDGQEPRLAERVLMGES